MRQAVPAIVMIMVGAAAAAAQGPLLFTAAQAGQGAVDYGRYCASCHGGALQGLTGPKLVGQDFASAGDHYSLGLVFTNLWEGTPAGAPDSLSRTQYVDIMAFLLLKNGFAPGPEPLTFDSAAASKTAFASRVP